MAEHENRRDLVTAVAIREALVLQRALGYDAAKAFLQYLQVPPETAARVLLEPTRRRENKTTELQPAHANNGGATSLRVPSN